MKSLPSNSLARATTYDYCASHLFPFMTMLNIEVEPQYTYSNKLFLPLCMSFNHFLNDANQRTALLEAPPRSGKTEFLFTVVLPYIIGNNPGKRMMIITSTKATREFLNRLLERIIKSEFYQKVFPSIGKSKFSAERFDLANGFYILFTTALSTVPTGSGFHFIVTSDYISASWVNSPSTMTTSFQNWEGFMTRKQNNPPTKVLIDNQRLGYYDLSWKVVQGAERQGEQITRITLPYQFQDDYKLKLPNGLIMPYKKGEYLTERFNDREKRNIIASTSEEVYRVQYLQDPLRDKGKIFHRAFFRFYRANDLETINFIDGFITTDLAFKRTLKADFTVFIFWMVDDQGNLYLIDMYRDKVDGVSLNQALYNFFQKWRYGKNSCGCSTVLVETAGGSNQVFINTLRNGFYIEEGGKLVYLDCHIKELIRSINKSVRARQSLGYLQSGKVFLPSYDVQIDGVRDVMSDIVEPLLSEADEFSDDDSHKHDDICDCLIDGINHINARAYGTSDINVDRIG